MPEVLERPPNQFTSETARQAAYASHQAQAALKEDGIRFRELALEQAKVSPEAKAETDAQREAIRQINLANELVTHARKELERLQEDDYGFCPECKRHGADAKDQAALIRELRGLMEHLCRLHNISQAPTSKASSKPTRPQHTLVDPKPIETPQPVVLPPAEPSA